MRIVRPTPALAPSHSSWLDALEANYDSAKRSTGSGQERSYRIGGICFKLSFAGTTLGPLISPAFEHLATADTGEPAAITINLFDQRDSSLTLPPAPGTMADFSPRGDIRNFNTAEIKAAFQPFGKILSTYHTERHHGVVSYGDPSGIYNFERAAPLRGMLGWSLRSFKMQLVHAGAVACAQGGVLLGGKGGSGKSNTALTCLLAGMDYLGDDFCAVTTKPRPTVYSLYGTARTRTADWDRLPFLETLADRNNPLPQDKELYYLRPTFPRQVIEQSPLRAILLPTIDPAQPLKAIPVSAREALLALAPVTTSLLPDAGGEIISNLSALIRQLPCYRLYLGQDMSAIPGAIRALIRDHAGA